MKKKTLKAGLAGSGFAASFHFESLKRIYDVDVEVAGVYSPTIERRDKFASRREITAYESLEQLIDKSDIIHVCTPSSTHESIAAEVLEKDKFAIVEKPLTGYFGDGLDTFNGEDCPKQTALDSALQSVSRLLEAENSSRGKILYAENWVYVSSIQKEREIIEKTRAQILWMHGEESHSGSHSPTYGMWSYSGGGSIMGKACHPLTAVLYLKRVEGKVRMGKPIRPKAVTSRTASLTRLDGFIDEGHLRTDYRDVEDFSFMHVVFEDGTLADIFASEIVLGGVHNWLDVCANNHRTLCRINPNNAMNTYNPVEANFKDIYIVEKIGTKQGWSNPATDEDLLTGYPAEMQAFYRTAAYGEPLESDSSLAADTISTIYSAYLSAEKNGTETEIILL